MNLVSITVSGALMGILSPYVAQMSVQPIFAQKRANNFSAAEAVAVSYAALNEQASELSTVPDNCELSTLSNSAYEIICIEGEGKWLMSASRSFRLQTTVYNIPPTVKEGPYTRGVFCPPFDPDGTLSFDHDHQVVCNPNWPGA